MPTGEGSRTGLLDEKAEVAFRATERTPRPLDCEAPRCKISFVPEQLKNPPHRREPVDRCRIAAERVEEEPEFLPLPGGKRLIHTAHGLVIDDLIQPPVSVFRATSPPALHRRAAAASAFVAQN